MNAVLRPCLLCGLFNSFEDLQIPRAAAQIPAKGFFDLSTIRRRVFLQERLRNQEDPRRAVSALSCAEIRERSLQRMKIRSLCQPFDRRDVLPFKLRREQEAGQRGLAVNQDRTGSAFSDFTTVFGSRKAEIIAQYFQQSPARVCGDLSQFAIDH